MSKLQRSNIYFLILVLLTIFLPEYLIKTYTNENDLVLDFTMGSGSTGVACLNTNRRFVGIELDEKYFNIAKNRIENIS